MADFNNVILAIVIGLLVAVVYSLRYLMIIDRKLDRLLENKGQK